MFAVVDTVGGRPRQCTEAEFWRIVRSPRVAELCARIEAGEAALKRKLPAFCFHATFGGKARREANAAPSGLAMLDLDHMATDPRDYAATLLERVRPWLLLLHVTPSGRGLRLVLPRYGMGLAEAQRFWASRLGVAQYDGVVKDLARLSFAVPEKNIIYVNNDLFRKNYETENELPPALRAGGGEEEKPAPAPGAAALLPDGAAGPAAAAPAERPAGQPVDDGALQPGGEVPGDEPAPVAADDGGGRMGAGGSPAPGYLYHGVPAGDIAGELMVRLGGDPVEGERNTRLYAAARYLRYIADFSPARLARLLPAYGLPPEEVGHIAESACRSPRAAQMPPLLSRIVAELSEASEDASEVTVEPAAAPVREMPPMPDLFRIFADTCPPEYKAAMVLSLLPICGTLATRIRGEYIDRTAHSPSFMTCLIAPQASGKSFTRVPVRLLLEEVAQQDAVERAKEQAYMQALRKAKNASKQPEDPRALVRIVPVSISVSKLLKRLDTCEEQHLFSFSEELDTLTKSNSAGAWAQKTDIYRLAFDNAEYGQDYMSDNSYSALVRVYYNLLLCGTPGAAARFFRNAEDGLVSRFIFLRLPDMFGAQLPKFRPLTRREQDQVRGYARQLSGARAVVKTTLLKKGLAQWQEEKRLEALETESAALDTFRRRAGVIGFRAGMLANVLTAGETKANAAFARWVADTVLDEQCALFGRQLEEQTAEAQKSGQRHTTNLYRLLPETFDRGELIALRVKNRQSSNINALLTRWMKNGMIERTDRKTYKKLAKQ